MNTQQFIKRQLLAVFAVGVLACGCTAVWAQIIFPLPIPTRATNFPLSGPIVEGVIAAWGYNANGQTDVPSSLLYVAAIAGGTEHVVALDVTGRVVAWGDSQNGKTTIPDSATNVVAIATGNEYTLVLKSDGRLVGWGNGGYGQTNVPSGLSNVVSVAAGKDHSLAVTSDGKVSAWGYGAYGQANVPSALTNAVVVAAGWWHSVALETDGTVSAWGLNNAGQISVPAGLSGVVSVSAGLNHTLALKNNGTVVAWGDNGYGQSSVPPVLSNVVAIAAGYNHSLALKSDGALVGWGSDAYGQVTLPPWLTNTAAVAAGGNFTVALWRGKPPEITMQPTGRRVFAGSAVNFTVSSSGIPNLFSWRKDGSDIAGASAASLVLSNVAASDAGQYSVIVSNALGIAVSSNASLVVLPFGMPIAYADSEEIVESLTKNAMAELTFETQFPNGYVFYTLDGSNPTFGSTIYSDPLAVTDSVIIRALAVNADFTQTVEAPPVFLIIRHYLPVDVWSEGGGMVSISPPGNFYATGDVVTITATAGGGWSFLRWEGHASGSSNPLTLHVNTSMQVQAVFATTILTNTVGNGRIEITPAIPTAFGGTVELRAIPDSGQKFVAWGNAVTGTNNPRAFTVIQPNLTVAALFAAGPAGMPIITMQPSNRVLSGSAEATLSVAADGQEPLRYQWRRNGVAVPGATNASLTIGGDTGISLGIYDVVITNPSAAVTSLQAYVAVQEFDVRPVVTIMGVPGMRVQVEYADEIDAGVWRVMTNTILSTQQQDFIDFTTTNRARRFYRTQIH